MYSHASFVSLACFFPVRRSRRQSATEEERSRLPKYGDASDSGLCRALESLRPPLRFDVLAGTGFGPQENPASVTYIAGHGGWLTAMSGHVMRGGRHFVGFTIECSVDQYGQTSAYVHLGVIRPVSLTNGIDWEADWNRTVNPMFVSSRNKPAVAEKLRSQRTARWGDSNIHCCTYRCGNGQCHWTDWSNKERISDWQGHEGLGGTSGTVGLLLDLDEGTLSVLMNGRRLGVMKDGLGGEYVWFVSVYSPCIISMAKCGAPK